MIGIVDHMKVVTFSFLSLVLLLERGLNLLKLIAVDVDLLEAFFELGWTAVYHLLYLLNQIDSLLLSKHRLLSHEELFHLVGLILSDKLEVLHILL